MGGLDTRGKYASIEPFYALILVSDCVLTVSPVFQVDTVVQLKNGLLDDKLRGVVLCNFPRERNHIEQFNETVRAHCIAEIQSNDPVSNS